MNEIAPLEQFGTATSAACARAPIGLLAELTQAQEKAVVADKKLLLVLTDGEPADIDSKDGRILIEDARQAVNELGRRGIYSYCINLDPKADEYVADIFGKQYTIIDRVESLPERLPTLFLSLTK